MGKKPGKKCTCSEEARMWESSLLLAAVYLRYLDHSLAAAEDNAIRTLPGKPRWYLGKCSGL